MFKAVLPICKNDFLWNFSLVILISNKIAIRNNAFIYFKKPLHHKYIFKFYILVNKTKIENIN